jgi:uncharacterized repeat protein (TIGR03803 family)
VRQKQVRLAMRGILAALAMVLMLPGDAVAASNCKVLHSFTRNTDGKFPQATLVFDGAGDLYGTTYFGGEFRTNCDHLGCGVVFRLAPNSGGNWTESVLYSFAGGKDGLGPQAGLILDGAGNLYGTTVAGGDLNECSHFGCGVVFKLAPNSNGSWTESVLYKFTGGADGSGPFAGLIFDGAGNLYGATASGGLLAGSCSTFGCGVVFKLTPNSNGSWTESVLYRFTGGSDGFGPSSDLIFDAAGDLYGTTVEGGDSNCGGKFGCGVVFKLAPNVSGSWSETVLHRFSWSRDGAFPDGGLVFDGVGDLYGTTASGGNSHDCFGDGCGVVFKLTPNADGTWAESVLKRFAGSKGGADPFAGLIFDMAGNLYGTTPQGGETKDCNGGAGCGVVFELTPNSNGSWTERVLHVFNGHPAANAYGGLVFDKAGNLYGTTGNCAGGCGGVVFEVTP